MMTRRLAASLASLPLALFLALDKFLWKLMAKLDKSWCGDEVGDTGGAELLAVSLPLVACEDVVVVVAGVDNDDKDDDEPDAKAASLVGDAMDVELPVLPLVAAADVALAAAAAAAAAEAEDEAACFFLILSIKLSAISLTDVDVDVDGVVTVAGAAAGGAAATTVEFAAVLVGPAAVAGVVADAEVDDPLEDDICALACSRLYSFYVARNFQ